MTEEEMRKGYWFSGEPIVKFDPTSLSGREAMMTTAAALRSLAAERDALQARVAELEGALRIAKISIKTWGAHSSKHYRELWDLAGDIKKIDVALEGKKDV